MSISLYSAIYRRLVSDSTFSSLVSSACVFHGMKKDGVFPSVVIDIEQDSDTSINKRPAQHYDVIISCESLAPDTRDAIAASVESRINRQTWTDSNVSVVSVLLTGSSCSASAESGNAEQEYFTNELTFHFIAGV